MTLLREALASIRQDAPPLTHAGSVVGRLATRPYRHGDPLPAVGSQCLVSGAHCDVESDQHRSYSWRQVIGYSDNDLFVCLQTGGCWPTVEKTAHCWFAEIQEARTTGAEATGTTDIKAEPRLIAAAPELLDALREVLKHEKWHAAAADEVTPEARAAIKMADAAIAKATGGAA